MKYYGCFCCLYSGETWCFFSDETWCFLVFVYIMKNGNLVFVFFSHEKGGSKRWTSFGENGNMKKWISQPFCKNKVLFWLKGAGLEEKGI